MFNKSIIIAFFLNIVFSTEESINYKIHSIDRNNMILYEEDPEIINYSDTLDVISPSENILMKYHDKILINSYHQELIIALKSGEIFQVSNIKNIAEGIYEINILKQNLSSDFFYYDNNSINKIKNQSSYPKRIKEISLDEILYIDTIDYEKQFKIMRNYTILTISFFYIINVFF